MGFYAVFLEAAEPPGSALIYMLYRLCSYAQLGGVPLRGAWGHRQSGNWSTTDGTEVLYRPLKSLF